MISRDLARRLTPFLEWSPQNGDHFFIPRPEISESVFTVSDMVVELVAEHVHRAAPRALSPDVPSAGCTVNGLPCAVDCCVPGRRPSRPGPDVSGQTVTTAAVPG